ncbi:MAG: lysyl-tRNA synthetase, class [Thermoleophilaceae bacterium]|nr:lysyl-tRNA synthetase, class [Thermoleophilaceae bacterium]
MTDQTGPPPAAGRRRPAWLPPLAGWLTAIAGLLNVASALTPNLAERARVLLHVEDSEFVPLAHALALSAGVALLVLAAYLGRRRRRALQLAVVVLAFAGALNLIKGLDVEEAAIDWALAAFLVWGRGAFYVRHELPLRHVLRAAPLLALLAFAAALTAVYAASGSVSPRFGFAAAVREAFDLLLLTGGPLHFHGHFGWVPTAVGIVSMATLVAIAWGLFRPLSAPLRREETARRAAVELVRSHGNDTLSFFKLRDDKHYLFSPDRRAFAGYRVENGVLLVSGDPVGPADALPGLTRELRAFADVRGLKIAVLGASDQSLPLWEGRRTRSFYIGDEAVVEVERFSLEGRPIRKVRQSVTRMRKAGFEASLHELGELDERTLCELEHVSERWRQGEPERGFSMAMDTLRGEHLHDSLVLVARDGEGAGAVRGFLHFVPVYGRDAVSLSFMRREHDTPNGLTEFMVARAMELLRERGVREASLNFAAFARLMHSPSGRVERLLGRLAALFNPYFQIESLYRFNAKFFPRWEPRYLVYEGALGLPRAGLAAMWAEGQLPKPKLRT